MMIRVARLFCLLSFTAFLGVSCSRDIDVNNRVINGVRASPEDFPFYVLTTVIVTSWNETFERIWCGSSIITRRHLLTASHCMPEYVPELQGAIIHAYAGNPTVKKDGTFWGEQRLRVKRIASHSSGPRFHDIAVIELEAPLNFTTTVKPVKMSDQAFDDSSYGNGECYITGYGLLPYKRDTDFTVTNLTLATKLMTTKVAITPNFVCRYLGRKSIWESLFFSKTVMCTANAGGNGGCSGDSGGPVTCKDSRGRHRLVGLASTVTDRFCVWGIGYQTRVSRFRNWIAKQL